ncbi:hypothetical protein KI387_001824, partial [Taxus chinensis]
MDTTLNRENRKNLSCKALGHLGQKDAVDAKEPADPRTNQEMTRVTREKSKSQRASFEGAARANRNWTRVQWSREVQSSGR